MWEKPLMSTLLRASSHMSQELSFHTWVAMLYSSISGSCTGGSLRQVAPGPGPLRSPSRGQHQPCEPGVGVSPPAALGSDLGEVELQGVVGGQ